MSGAGDEAVRPTRRGRGHLFVCGCPRSGTTALSSIFNCHADALVGQERYPRLIRRRPRAFLPALFRAARFQEFVARDCGYASFADHAGYWGKNLPPFDPARIDLVRFAGDKITELYKHFTVFNATA